MMDATMKLMPILKRIAKDESGATAIEYGLIIALVAISALGALSGLANETSGTWDKIASRFATSSEEARTGL